MSKHVYKSHNKTLLLYHLVFPAKYRRKVFSETVEESLREVCIGITECYEINFVEIGLEEYLKKQGRSYKKIYGQQLNFDFYEQIPRRSYLFSVN